MIKGNLIIRPLSAKLLHDTELFGKMDPYVKVTVGTNSKLSPVAKGQHLQPSWDSEFCFRIQNDEVIYFEVFNKETISRDDLIGSGSIYLSSLLNKGPISDWLPLVYKDKPAGELLLEIQFFPDGGVLGASQVSSKGVTTFTTDNQPSNLGIVGQEQGVSQEFTQPSMGYQTYGQQNTGYTQVTNHPTSGYSQGYREGYNLGISHNQGVNQGVNQ